MSNPRLVTQIYKNTNDPIKDGEFDDRNMDISDVVGLFASVIMEHWKLAFYGRNNDTYHDASKARDWFGSEGFHEVCYLAGICGHSVFRAFKLKAATAHWGEDYV